MSNFYADITENDIELSANFDTLNEELDADINTGTGGVIYKAGQHIDITNNVISVLTTDEASEDNTRPITSAAVNTIVGNIETILETI